MIPVKLRHLSPALFVALLVVSIRPTVVRADTIYYRQVDVAAIQSVSGKIVREANGLLEIATADGRTVSIPRRDVFQIVPETRSAEGGPEPAEQADALEEYPGVEQFPAASALARGATFDEVHSRSSFAYHYGFKGGMNISNVRADPQELEEGGSLRGYAFGFWLGLPLSYYLTIQPEVIFSMKGDSETAAGYTASTHLSYFDLPVLAKVGFLHDARIQPSLFVGPSLGLNLAAHSSLEGEDGEIDMDVKDQVGTVDLGLVIGGGLDFGKGGRTFGVDVRYSRGLSDVESGSNGSAHNEAITVMGSIGLR